MIVFEEFSKLGFNQCEVVQGHIIYKKCAPTVGDYIVVKFFPNKSYVVLYEKHFLDEYGNDEFYEWIYGINEELNNAIQKQLKELWQ